MNKKLIGNNPKNRRKCIAKIKFVINKLEKNEMSLRDRKDSQLAPDRTN